jgi:cell division protein FtsA
VALLDIGGGTTDLAIFDRGAAWHTAVLPVGGSHFSNDLAVGLRTPIPDAERLKRKYGRALTSMVEGDETVEVPSVGGRQPRQLSLRMMAEILEPRASEIFSLIHQEVARAGFDRSLNAGVVLTGGGSILPGMSEVAEQIFDLPVRIGPPDGIHGLADPGSAPQFATAIGLAMYSARNRPPRARMSFSVPVGGFGRVGGRVKAWFSEIF